MARPLSPTLKDKKRYVAFEVEGANVSSRACHDAILTSALSLFGVAGVAKMGLQMLSERYSSGHGVIRVTHTHANHIRAALCCITTVAEKPCRLRTTRTSGILAKAC